MGDGGGKVETVLVPLAAVAMVVVVVAACPDAGKVSLRSAWSVRTRLEREGRTRESEEEKGRDRERG